MPFKRIFRDMDYVLFFAVLALISIGIILIGSATHINETGIANANFVKRQALFAIISILFGFFLMRLDYKGLQEISPYLYVFNIVLLLAVMFIGTSALGAQRWIQIGSITLQPSEFSKIIMIICMAEFLTSRWEFLDSFFSWLPVFAYMFVPFVLVMKQPDLGTSLVFVAILTGMMIVTGFKTKYFLYLFGAGIVSFPLLWHILKEYQKMRIRVFVNPGLDPYGAGYHVIQSMIAIGSGTFLGKGLYHGTQSQLNFLPENHTDFIFAVAGEEFGLVGTVIILLLYLIVIYRGIMIAKNCNDDFGTLLAVGIVSVLTFHVLVNVGMTAGIMPVTGVPLPFISYGVSSLTTNMILVFILENIQLHNQSLKF